MELFCVESTCSPQLPPTVRLISDSKLPISANACLSLLALWQPCVSCFFLIAGIGSTPHTTLNWISGRKQMRNMCGHICAISSCSEQVLGVVDSKGLHDPGPVRWPLALCLLAAWIIIFLCMLKGIRSSGKVTQHNVLIVSTDTNSCVASARISCWPHVCPCCLCFQVVYVTATFPYFVLIVLIIRGATLEGSLQGVAFYLTPDWSRLANAQVDLMGQW